MESCVAVKVVDCLATLSFCNICLFKTVELCCFQMSLGSLSELTDLNLDDNELTSLPESIGDLMKLQSLALSDNRLQSLPRRCCRLVNLEIVKAR